MNEELLAAGAFLVRSGALLVSVNIGVGLPNLVSGWWYAGTCNCPKLAMAAPQRELEPQFSL
jgi:hypothetical protein